MKVLAGLIRHRLRLESNKFGHCAVYETELQGVWPLVEKNRRAKIEQFAKEHGFRLADLGVQPPRAGYGSAVGAPPRTALTCACERKRRAKTAPPPRKMSSVSVPFALLRQRHVGEMADELRDLIAVVRA